MEANWITVSTNMSDFGLIAGNEYMVVRVESDVYRVENEDGDVVSIPKYICTVIS